MDDFKCKICGSETEEINYEQFDIKYHYCRKCEFISKDNRSIISAEEELKIYETHVNSIDDRRYVDYFKKFIDDAIMPFCGEGKYGLDFGSGPSPVLAMILERDYGYSMNIYDIFYATAKIYHGKKYDLITSTEVVEHLENPIKYFSLFSELMDCNTLLVIMTQFHPVEEEKLFKWHYMRDMSHISFYTSKTMSYISDKIGLEMVFTDHIRYTSFRLKRRIESSHKKSDKN
ncbi:MAG: class I SAM-dependent methyltransferase [Clostridiales bacterium]|nr:class I SAM-dependent methyltransferase [Clostridiales bacterium]